jgi:nitronate monooxygenase
VQGSDAGGLSVTRCTSIVSVVLEAHNKLQELQPQLRRPIQLFATGGISDRRGVTAAINLRDDGCVLGTRFLTSPEATIADDYQKEILRASDVGVTTFVQRPMTKYVIYMADQDFTISRGLINWTYVESVRGMSEEENR